MSVLLLVLTVQGSLATRLPLDGLHGCAVERLLGLRALLVGRDGALSGSAVDSKPLPQGHIHIVDAHQQAVVHDLKTLQQLEEDASCIVELGLHVH